MLSHTQFPSGKWLSESHLYQATVWLRQGTTPLPHRLHLSQMWKDLGAHLVLGLETFFWNSHAKTVFFTRDLQWQCGTLQPQNFYNGNFMIANTLYSRGIIVANIDTRKLSDWVVKKFITGADGFNSVWATRASLSTQSRMGTGFSSELREAKAVR